MIANLLKCAAVAAALFACGCKNQPKIDVFQPQPAAVQPSGSGFSDETYVWENWTHSTNRVPDKALK